MHAGLLRACRSAELAAGAAAPAETAAAGSADVEMQDVATPAMAAATAGSPLSAPAGYAEVLPAYSSVLEGGFAAVGGSSEVRRGGRPLII